MSRPNPKISVIICTHRREAFLAKAVESVLSQTFRDFELIIVENGCDYDYVSGYAPRDSRIRVIHSEGVGVAIARNAGLDAARGEWVTFVDDDDICEPGMLEFLIGLAVRNGADIAVCGSWYIDENGNKTDKFVGDETCVYDSEQSVIEMLKREKFNSGTPTKLFRRALFDNIRFKENTKHEDIWVVYRVFAEACKTAYCGRVQYAVLRHRGNLSGFTTQHKDTLSALY
jgi:glycosyltransferase involved in cell wall biosynthesis